MSSFRITTMIWMACYAIALFGIYVVKYTAQDLQREVTVAQDELKKEQQSLHLLNAEWAYLNRPDRLRHLAEKHLALAPMDSRQIEEIKLLPAAYDPSQAPEAEKPTLYQPASTTAAAGDR